MKVEKFNEFINNDEFIILKLIEESEMTNLPDLESISVRSPYRKIIEIGEKAIPFLIKRNSIVWDIALSEITGAGLNPLEHNTSERQEYWKKWATENVY